MNASEAAATASGAPQQAVLSFVTLVLEHVQQGFNAIPGSAILLRYIRNSHQNDPWRTVFEILLFAFAVRTVFSSRTRTDQASKNFVQLSEKEIDELVTDWTPEPLVAPRPVLASDEHTLETLPVILGPTGARVKLAANPSKQVLNLASANFTGLAEDERMKESALGALRKYGLGTCGPPGFYGNFDVHQQLERNLASFLGQPSAIIYAQAFSCISSVIPAFAKRSDVLVVDRGCNFAIMKGAEVSRSKIIYYEHGDMSSLEQALTSVVRDANRKGGKLTRRFIITEGLFEADGWISDLEKLVELKKKYKFRLILDESQSFGTLGATGRGLTELSGVPASEVDMITGSMANTLSAGGGFCAGSNVVTSHQRINSAAYVYSAALPTMLATTASTALTILESSPQIFTTLQTHIALLRSALDPLDAIHIPSHPLSPLVHLQLAGPPPTTMEGIEAEEVLLQEVVDEALRAGVLVTRARRLRGQEKFEMRPSIKICLSSALTRKEVEKAVGALKSALIKVLKKRN